MSKNILIYFFKILKKPCFSVFSILVIASCTRNIKEETDKFERQVSPISTDEILVGDNLSFWETDIPQAGIFILNSKASFLKGFALKAIRYKEKDKDLEYLNKNINTEPLYQLEIYELNKNLSLEGDNTKKLDYKSPQICDYISNNFSQANLIVKKQNISFRIKEREWVWINTKVDPNSLIFLRLGIANTFGTLNNKSVDAIWINAKRNYKTWEEYLPNEKKSIISWGCQESVFMDNRVIEATFYNPDIVFNYY